MPDIEIRSELAGAVWKIEVAVGDAVEIDDTVLLLESMKMEVPVLAPRKGRVKAIIVAEKDLITEGQVLVILESS